MFFRNRLIENPDSWQARKFVPLIMKGRNETLTFSDFVNFILKNPEDLDSHWVPWSQHCRPDLVKFDFLIKVENLREDFKRYFDEDIDFRVNTSKLEVLKFWDTLNTKQKKGLKKLYWKDFQLLNYTSVFS